MNAQWLAVDWGTTNARIWAMSTDNQPVSYEKTHRPLQRMNTDEIVSTLEQAALQVEASVPVPVIACGMIGSSLGLVQAPYVQVPYTLDQHIESSIYCDSKIEVHVVAGIAQDHPADVMRGEETQLLGFAQSYPEFSGVVCLPGTHSKWVHIDNQTVTGFVTCMTGELYALLAQQSTLCDCIDSDWDEQAFLESVAITLEYPQKASSSFFAIRASALQGNNSGSQSRLSGLLLGMELAATKSDWQHPVAIIGSANLSEQYSKALSAQGVQPLLVDAQEMTLLGLTHAYQQLVQA